MLAHWSKTHKYEIMRLCWCMDPQERPKFQSLVMSLSRLLERESGYLDLSSSLCWKDTSDLPQSTESPLPAIDEERDEDDEGNDV